MLVKVFLRADIVTGKGMDEAIIADAAAPFGIDPVAVPIQAAFVGDVRVKIAVPGGFPVLKGRNDFAIHGGQVNLPPRGDLFHARREKPATQHPFQQAIYAV